MKRESEMQLEAYTEGQFKANWIVVQRESEREVNRESERGK